MVIFRNMGYTSLKADLKFKQKLWKINVKDFILCSVGRAVSIISDNFSCSNKLFALRWIYARQKLVIKIILINFSL